MSKGSLYIITGTSRGIGKALVVKLSHIESNRIIGIARADNEINQPNYLHLKGDLADLNWIEKNADIIFPEKDFEKIVLINNAGWIGDIAHFGKISNQSFNRIFEVNVIAPAVLMNEFIKKYSGLGNAKRIVINISSGAAIRPLDGWSGYSSSKAALNMLSQVAQMESEIDQNGIRFFALAPGVVDTDMQEAIRSASQSDFSTLPKFIGLKENSLLSSPETVAEKILYLIDNSEKFEGVVLDVRNFLIL